jgi:hypothetical protein
MSAILGNTIGAGVGGASMGWRRPAAGGVAFAVAERIAQDKGTNFAGNHTYDLNMTPEAGDLLIVAFNGDVATWTSGPTGFTPLISQNNLWVGYKVAVAEGPTTDLVITSATLHRSSAAFWRLTGGGTPVHAAGTPGNTFPGAFNPPAITPVAGLDDYIILAIVGFVKGAGQSVDPACTAAPSNFVNLITAQTFPEAASGARGGIAGAERQLTQVTTEDPGVFTFTSNPFWSSTGTIAIPRA